MRFRSFVIGGVALVIGIVLLLAPWTSSHPDGLERVAIDKGFAESSTAHALEDGPLAEYRVHGVEEQRVATALSGLIGVAITFVLVTGLFTLLRRSAARREEESS